MSKRANYEAVLEFFLWGFDVFTRRDCGLILAGFRVCESEWRANQLLRRLEQQRLIERQGRGAGAKFTITPTGRGRVRVHEPARQWDKPWDGIWRVFSYDLPEARRKDRMLLWRALRNHKLGLLQRSIWVWPHEVEAVLRAIIRAEGIPECFCGFRTQSVFLCTDSEVVKTAWDWKEIQRRHQTYQKHLVANLDSLKQARDLPVLARVARVEREAYQYAFSLDPLLPRALWPKAYAGPNTETRHQQFRALLRRRLPELAQKVK